MNLIKFLTIFSVVMVIASSIASGVIVSLKEGENIQTVDVKQSQEQQHLIDFFDEVNFEKNSQKNDIIFSNQENHFLIWL